MSRLFWLLVALCAAALALSAPFLLAAIRAAHPPLSPLALLAAQALQTLLSARSPPGPAFDSRRGLASTPRGSAPPALLA